MKQLLFITLALLLTACTMKPSDQLIAQQVEQQILGQHAEGLFEFVNFKKLNGISRDKNNYEVEVEYDLRFLANLKDAAPNDNVVLATMDRAALMARYGTFKKGDTIHNKGWVKFVRSEKGWLLEPQH